MARFAQLSVLASVQPCHGIDDGRWVERVIGRRRSALAFPFRSLIDAGARLALGSDWPWRPQRRSRGFTLR